MKHLGGEPMLSSPEQALAVLRSKILPQYAQYGVGRGAVLLRDGSIFIGYCGLKYFPDIDQYDLGYRYFEEYWGKVMPRKLHAPCWNMVAITLLENASSAKRFRTRLRRSACWRRLECGLRGTSLVEEEP